MGIISSFRDWLTGKSLDAPDPKQRQKLLNELATPETGRVELYDLYEDYFGGEKGAELPERAASYLERSGLGFTENFTETVIETYANRFEIEGWSCTDDDVGEWIRDWWDTDEQREVQGIIHTNTPLLGDGVLAVEYDYERGAPALRWNHPRNCKFIYDHDGRLLLAAKVWPSTAVSPTNPTGTAIRRLNLYFPERIEKWFTLANDQGTDATWSMHLDEGDETWPTVNLDQAGEPLGISLFHFRHRPLGRSYGRSKLRNVIPQQDLLDKQIIDLVQIGDTQGWPKEYATGINETEQEKIVQANPGDMYLAGSKDAKFGAIPSAEMEGPLKAIEQTLRRISARSSTPISRLLTGTSATASGESQKMEWAGLVASVIDAQPSIGTTWGRVGVYVARLEANFGTEIQGYQGEPVKPQWRNPEPRDELNDWTVAETQQRVGLSRKTILEERGYDAAKEAEQVREEAQERQATQDRAPDVPGLVVPGA